jgi:hypothetical protein
VGSNNFITVDNLEICHNLGAGDFDGCISGGFVDNLLFENCYIHGWRTSSSTDNAHGGIDFNQGNNTISSVMALNCVLTNAENSGSGTQNGVAIRQVQTIAGCTIHDVSSAVLFTNDYNGNTMYNVSYPASNVGFDPTYHFNGVYLANGGSASRVSYVRNSIFHDIGAGANTIYPNPAGSIAQFVFNNLIYGVQSAQLPIEIDTYNYGNNITGGTVYCYNNTIVCSNDNSVAIHIVASGFERPPLDLLVAINNQVIYPTSGSLTDGDQGANVKVLTASNNLLQSASAASAQGYTLGNLYQPTPGGWTIHAGLPESGLFTTDILGIARPQGSTWDIGAFEYINPVAPISAGKFKDREGSLR